MVRTFERTPNALRLTRRRLLQSTALAAAGLAATHIDAGGATAQEERREGGTAAYLVGQEGAHIFPPVSSLSTVIVPSAPFFNGLTKPGAEREPTPDLAESWTVSDDDKIYTFKLRQGVTWHDGQPFTAHDVKFTWEIIAHPDNATGAQVYNFFSLLEGAPAYHDGSASEITGVRVVDDLTLEARLTAPSAPFINIASNQFIVPRHVLADVPVADLLKHPFARAPIGTGPFAFEAWNAGDSIVGRAYDGHFAGRPTLDRIVLRLAGLSGNALVTALKAGEVNAASVTLDDADALEGDSSLRLVQKPGQANQYIEFNLKSQFFADLKVRKALSYALNRQAIADLAWKSRAKIYNSVFPYDWWPTKHDTTLFDNDPAQAAQLLDEAGWTLNDDGVRERDGQPFSFTLHAFDQIWWQIVQQQWKEIGVEANLEIVDWPTMSTQFYLTKKFDAVALHVPYTLYTDPHYALPGYFLSANNRNSYDNPRSDELILAAAATTVQEERQALYYEWQEVIAQDVPHLWLGNPDQTYAYSADLIAPDRTSLYFEWRDAREWYFRG